jgi:hypothetical protein
VLIGGLIVTSYSEIEVRYVKDILIGLVFLAIVVAPAFFAFDGFTEKNQL